MKIKTIILPLAILTAGVLGAVALSELKQPPEEKVSEIKIPEVEVSTQVAGPVSVTVASHGIVQPREKTQLVAQVSGNVSYIHPAFVRGGEVAAGTVMMRIDDSDYQTALLDAEANYAAALAALETEQAQGKVAQEQLADVKNPTVLALRKPQLAQAKAAVKATLAMVQRAQRDLERTAIRAPFDALVVERQPGLGSFVSTGTGLGTVYALETAEVRLPVAAKHWPQLEQEGEGASVTLRVQQGDTTLEWPARIVRSEGIVDDNSRMHYLVAQVEAPYQQTPPLRFGQYVTADIQGRTYDNSLRIPYQWLRDQKIPVYDDGHLTLKNVDVLRLEGDLAVVRTQSASPLQVVTTALQYPSEGMDLHKLDASAAEADAAVTDVVASGSQE
jgi:RND family efflux transporter MFP subunit